MGQKPISCHQVAGCACGEDQKRPHGQAIVPVSHANLATVGLDLWRFSFIHQGGAKQNRNLRITAQNSSHFVGIAGEN